MKGLNKWHESADGEHSWYYSQRGSEDELFPKNTYQSQVTFYKKNK